MPCNRDDSRMDPSTGVQEPHRLPWLVDYVLVHELAHLLVTGHGPRFWAEVEGYPRSERARGYLEGVAAAAGLDIAPDVDGPD